MKRFGLATVFFCSFAQAAQAPSFLARADRTRVGLGETLVLEVTLSVEDGRVDGYHAPEAKGFRLISEQPSQSMQMQMGGGANFVQTVYSWRYQLEAVVKGTMTIGAARVRVAGRELKTAPITVAIQDASAPGARAPGGFNPLNNMKRHPFSTEPTATAPDGKNFLRLVPSKTKAYVGEQITAEWFLYLTERQDKYQTTTEPRADGFWSEDLLVPQSQRGLQLSREMFEGQVYLVAPLLRRALFGLQPGKLIITPMESEISQVDFFGSTVRTEKLKNDPVTIEVMPLPSSGQPKGFDPSSVGHFVLGVKLDRDRVAVGEAVTLTITVTGEGNLRKLTPPALGALPGWKVYEPKVTVSLEPGDTVTGVKSVEYLLLPEKPGVTTIPALTLAYFDPAAKSYATDNSKPLRIEVLGEGVATGVPSMSKAGGSSAPGAENVLGVDVRPVRARASFRRDLGATFYRSSLFGGLVAAPPLAFGLTLLLGRIRERMSQETEGARRRKLRHLVRRRLGAAESHLNAGRGSPFYIEIDRVLRELLTGKLGRAVTGLSRDELRTLLVAAGFSAELAAGLLGELEACDRARFAPGNVTENEMRAALDRAGEMIIQIEKVKLKEGALA